jgi:hypothetical protein
MNCWMQKSCGIYCLAEQASRAVNISRRSRLYGFSCCSSNVVSTYALCSVLTNNYSNKQIHLKRLKIIQKISNSYMFQRQSAKFREFKIKMRAATNSTFWALKSENIKNVRIRKLRSFWLQNWRQMKMYARDQGFV